MTGFDPQNDPENTHYSSKVWFGKIFLNVLGSLLCSKSHLFDQKYSKKQ